MAGMVLLVCYVEKYSQYAQEISVIQLISFSILPGYQWSFLVLVCALSDKGVCFL